MKELFKLLTGRSAALCAVLSISLCQIRAQTLPFIKYTTEEGLPQNEVTTLMEDSRGFIWVATPNGLARFDGTSFTSYFKKDGLPTNQVSSIIEDSRGAIWAVTKKGLARFNGKDFIDNSLPEEIRRATFFVSSTTINPDVITAADLSGDSLMKLYLYNPGRPLVTEDIPVSTVPQIPAISYSQKDSAILLYFDKVSLYKDGESRILGNGKTVMSYGYFPMLHFQLDDGLYYYYNNGRLVAADSLGAKTVRQIRELHIMSVDTLLRMMSPSAPSLKWQYGMTGLHIRDRAGRLWLPSPSGLYCIPSGAFTEYDYSSGLMINPWAVVADPNGGLLIGSIHGELARFDGEKFTPVRDGHRVFSQEQVYFRGSRTMSDGEVWLSTNRGVVIWDGKKFTRLEKIDIPSQVCTIYEDPVDGSKFVGTERGLYHITDDTVKLYSQFSPDNFGVAEGITRDDNGNYWVATQLGLCFFDGTMTTSVGTPSGLIDQSWGVIKDLNGNIWCASSDGLFICDPIEKEPRPVLPAEDNLPVSVIRDLGDGRLLAGRMADLCIIDLQKYYSSAPDFYTVLGSYEGFRGNDVQDNGIVRDRDGRWWILTSDKLILFNPAELSPHDVPPLVHLTMVEGIDRENNWVTLLDSTLFTRNEHSVTLTGGRNDLRIRYLAITSGDPEAITYQFRMMGRDGEWSPKSTGRSVIFSNLRPGRYTFEVNAFSPYGVKSTGPERLSVTVMPTLFQTKAAIILVSLLAIILTIILTMRIRRSVYENKIVNAKKQAEQYRLQLNSIIRQFDPHFTFNAVSSVGSLIMKGEKERAYEYFIKLSGILRMILTDSSALLKPLSEELDFVRKYCDLQKLRFGQRFDFEIDIQEGVNLNATVPKMIIQSFAENAVKHGLENKDGKGLLNISLEEKEKGIEITVKDNGIGRHAAAEMRTSGGGLGLKNLTGIIDLMNSVNTRKITFSLTDLYYEGKPSGTIVRIFLPSDYNFDIIPPVSDTSAN